jgi:opacity protein-like surface antigen
MNFARNTTLIVGLVMLSAAAVAEDTKMELTPFAGYRFGGTFELQDDEGSYEIEDSSSYGLILNIKQNFNTQWEVIYSRQETQANFSEALSTDPRIDVDIQLLQLGGTYLGDGDKVRPYLVATLGGTHIKTASTGSSSDTFWSGSIGGGVQFLPTSRLGIRLEARAYGTLVSSNSAIFCGSGPEGGTCTVLVEGKLLTQVETLVGVVFRF